MPLDWGLILGVIGVIGIPASIGVGIAVADPRTKGEFLFACGCFVVSALLTASSFILLTNEIPLGPGKIISAGALGAVTLIGLVIAIDWTKNRFEGNEKPSEQIQSSSPALSPPSPLPEVAPVSPSEPEALLDFSLDMLPRISPSSGKIPIFEIREQNGQIEAHVIDYQMDPSVVIDWRRMIPEWPVFGVAKCEITSTKNEPIFYAVFSLGLGFQEMMPDPDHPGQSRSGKLLSVQKAQFRVGRVSPHETYVLYFMNRTKYLVNIVVPTEGIWQDFSVRGPDFEKKIHLKLGRTEGLHLTPVISPPTPPPPAPAQPNTPEKK